MTMETITQSMNADQSEEVYIRHRWPWVIALKYLVNRIGLPTALVIFGLGVWTGHIPSPFMDIAHSLEDHVMQTDTVLDLLIANQKLLITMQAAR